MIDLIKQLFDLVIHIDQHLAVIMNEYQTLTYLILFVIIFCETGLVVTPFLPGDSLLFATGAVIAAQGVLNVWLLIPLLILAALLGDNSNYFIGKYLGKKGKGAKLFGVFTIREDYLERTHDFYEKNGGATIIIARFFPIIRTFAPFVAGVAQMNYRKYILFCITGAILWVYSVTLLGYYFGGLEIVKNNFEIVILGITGLSMTPVLYQLFRKRLLKKSDS